MSALQIHAISKSFGNNQANDKVSFEVARGTIHGIVGENGAGKSTIMKIVYGMYPPDEGFIAVDGKKVPLSSPRAAARLGIGMVHQHFMLVPSLSIWENVILGAEPRSPWLHKQRICDSIHQLQKEFGFRLDPIRLVETLSLGEQQQVEILKLLYRQNHVLILDEPTAVLTPQEVDELFNRLKSYSKAGKTIILVTHKLREILEFTHTVTVMRGGKVIATKPTIEFNEHLLAECIVGNKLPSLRPRKSSDTPQKILEIQSLCLLRNEKKVLSEISLCVHSQEIVGIAGIEGNGQRELIETLAHVEARYTGEIIYKGQNYKNIGSYRLKQSGVSVVPQDRQHEGLILDFSLEENFSLGHHREKKVSRQGWILKKERLKSAKEAMGIFDVRPKDPLLPARALSGGNQQKLILARELSKAHFLIAANPTRGVDIGATQFIHDEFLRLRNEGVAILLISSELDEILALSDRILVIYGGRIVAEVRTSEAVRSKIGQWMTGGKT